MKRDFFATVLSIAFAAIMIVFPSMSVDAVSEALKLWALTVVPSLLPFFICSNFMMNIGLTDRLALACEPVVQKVFRTSGGCAFPFIMSLVSGYPVGVKIISDLRKSGSISRIEAEKGITFCSTSGPLFMIGAVGAGMLGSGALGWIVAGAHYLGAVCNGILFGRLIGEWDRKSDGRGAAKRITGPAPEKNYNSLASNAIMDSCRTLLLIGGFMAIFMMAIYLLRMLAPGMPPWASGLFELSVGCNEVALAEGYSEMMKVVICSSMVSFGGLCVLAQSMSFIGESDISLRVFLVSKVTHGVFTGGIALVLYKVVVMFKGTAIATVAQGLTEQALADMPEKMGLQGFVYHLLFSGGMICVLAGVFLLITIFYFVCDREGKGDS